MAVASKNIPAPDLVRVRRALLSVSDKTGLVDFAAALSKAGIELVSTGGTAKAIAAADIAVRDVSEVTGFPEIMDGRVKTLHPAIHGGILGIRDDADHALAMDQHDIRPIDLVVVNLYPFEEVRFSGGDYASVVENIDIGGPAMLRAAAKNHAYVAIVTDPEDYAAVLNALDMNFGSLSLEFRTKLAAKAFARTAAYDAAISGWFAETLAVEHPVWRGFGGRLESVMRYGENPHQAAGFYVNGDKRPGVATARQVQGKQLSYNNINDTDAAFELAAEFDPAIPAVAIVKHANPCGVATGETLKAAYEKALRCDPVSAFGGIVAMNRDARRGSRGRDRQDLHRGDHRAGCHARGTGDRRRQEEPAAFAGRRLAGPARRRDDGEIGCRRHAGAVARQRRGRRSRSEGGDEARTDGGRDGRPAFRLRRRQACQVQRHRLCQGRSDGRHRRRPDEPGRFLTHRCAQGARMRHRRPA